MSWLRQLFSRRRIYGDLSDEIREHLHEKVEELVAGGMSRKDAEAAARAALDSTAQPDLRDRHLGRVALLVAGEKGHPRAAAVRVRPHAAAGISPVATPPASQRRAFCKD